MAYAHISHSRYDWLVKISNGDFSLMDCFRLGDNPLRAPVKRHGPQSGLASNFWCGGLFQLSEFALGSLECQPVQADIEVELLLFSKEVQFHPCQQNRAKPDSRAFRPLKRPATHLGARAKPPQHSALMVHS